MDDDDTGAVSDRFAILGTAVYLKPVAIGVAYASFAIAPTSPDDHDTYLVLDDFGERLGRAWRETGEERTDRETVVTDLIDGQYSNPARVIAFNTAEDGRAMYRRSLPRRSRSVAPWTALTSRPRWKGSSIGMAVAGQPNYRSRCEA